MCKNKRYFYLCRLKFVKSMLTKQQLLEIKSFISEGKKITLTTHTNPDGDAIGSSLAMYHYLKLLGADVQAVVPNKFPGFLKWLPSSNELIIFEKKSSLAKKAMLEADLLISLDYNAIHRVGAMSDILRKTKGTKLLIDHHLEPEIESFKYIWSETNTSSTGELVFEFISAMGDKNKINTEIAKCLYCCIITDTGSFSHSCENVSTWETMSYLISCGIDARELHSKIYDTFSENRLRLLGFAINDRMLVWDDLKSAVIYLTKEDLNKFKYKVGDTEGVVNFALSMDKVNLACLITEKDNKIRLSFRSKGKFSVNELARKHFNGGGHRNAAGGNLSLPVMEVVNNVKNVLQEYKEQLNY